MIAYGEDGVTLWALKNKLDQILLLLKDTSKIEECLVLYRPSFARGITGIGEFDFILLTEHKIYLGESKWIHSANRSKSQYPIDSVQLKRHKAFHIYYKTWLDNPGSSWGDFSKKLEPELKAIGIHTVPTEKSKLQENIISVFNIIQNHGSKLEIVNVLIFLKEKGFTKKIPTCASDDFTYIIIEFPKTIHHNFIHL